jgi:hypothetical protein
MRLDREENDKAKKDLFKALIELDFTEEISIKKLINMPYKVMDEDEDVLLSNSSFVKILKIMLYKLGLTYKR